jgi:imidazolonepropionase-like amidohydrolase
MMSVAPKLASQSVPLFTAQEMSAIVSTAREKGVKVAAHGNNNASILTAIEAGISTLEHGYDMDGRTLAALRDHGVFWNPTLSAYHTLGSSDSRWTLCQQTFRRAMDTDGLKIACGGDTGVFPHGNNARELQLMVKLGMPWLKVLQCATLRGWECVRSLGWEGEQGRERLNRIEELGEDVRIVGENEMPFGVLRKGFAADIIAVTGSLGQDLMGLSAEHIEFVMKSGNISKQ